MKIKLLTRQEEDFSRTRPNEIQKVLKNPDPTQHPFEKAREYTRALNSVKLGRVFAKPFAKALNGHKDSVYCISRHPAKLSLIASGSGDGEIKLWNISSGKNIASIEKAHNGFVRGLAVNKNGQVLSCGDDKYIHLFDVTQASWDLPLYDDPSYEQQIFDKNALVLNAPTKSYSSSIIREDKPSISWIGNEPFTSLSHHPKKFQFATSSSDGVYIWDYNRSDPLNHLTFGNNPDTYMTVSYNLIEKDIIAATASDRSIVLFDLRANVAIRKLVLAMNTNAIAWNPMEAFNFSIANEDHNCYTYDMRKLDIAQNVHVDHVAAVLDIDYSPTGREFVTGSYDKTIRIFPIDSGRSRDVYHTKRMQRVFSVRFTGDANYVLSGSDDTNIRLWKAQSDKKIGILSPREKENMNYKKKLVDRYKYMPELKKILNKRHAPKQIYRTQQVKQIMKNSQRRKLFNKRAHSTPGKVKLVPERRKNVVTEVE